MVILSVAYPLFPVSADSGGGAEQILHLVERGLTEAGHESIVIAAEGSQVAGTLIATATAAANEISSDDQRRAQEQHRDAIITALSSRHIDLIHFHGLDFGKYLPGSFPNGPIPMVATLHLPPSWYPADVFAISRIHLVCVSKTQQNQLPHQVAATVVQNGIDPIGRDTHLKRGDDLLWMGRICPEKGPHIALRVAHRLDCAIRVAGPVHGFLSHRAYFDEEVAPLLDERRRYIGPVGRAEKKRLLREAKALLIPSLAPETSSLVAMEAISAGTPVVAFSSGALPEVVHHGVTGLLVHSEEEMVGAIGQLGRLTMSDEPVHYRKMVANYLSLYERVISKRHLGV